MARKGLGKGLGSLIMDTAEESGVTTTITEIPIDDIVPNPGQPRRAFDEEGLSELASSIKQQGLLQPIIVRPVGDKYQIIAGERRWKACKLNKMSTVSARIMPVDEVKTLELALIENLQRMDLSPVEEARGYRSLIAASGMTQAQLAGAVSKSRSNVANTMRLLDLPDVVLEMIDSGKMTSGHGRAILSVPDQARQISLAQKIIDESLTVRQAENIARLYAAGAQDVPPKRTPLPASYKKMARKLRTQLDTSVRIREARGKHKIEIEFKDEADLERIFNIIQDSSSHS